MCLVKVHSVYSLRNECVENSACEVILMFIVLIKVEKRAICLRGILSLQAA